MNSNSSPEDKDRYSSLKNDSQNSSKEPGNNFQLQIPSITLPKGGGALKGIDEKFSVNAVNGSASFSIPLPITPGRHGFQPSLALSYNSGAGNSVFGLGWNIDFPSIQRKTDKQLPQYCDLEESDVFLFSGAEDLVPYLNEQGIVEIYESGQFTVKRYWPRIEGGFAKIEQVCINKSPAFYWKITARDNTVTFFGRTPAYQVSDPQNINRIFKWLPEISFDDKGNIILFEYKKEDGQIDSIALHDKNRFGQNGIPLFTQQYLKRVKYGNHAAFFPAYITNPADENAIYNPSIPQDIDYFFETVFDYGEHGSSPLPNADKINVSYEETLKWITRGDSFSDYRAGFDIRTYRLCQRILQFHSFEELGNNPCLVKSLDLAFADTIKGTIQETEITHLLSVTQRGYTRNKDGSYLFKGLPKMEFDYQALNWSTAIKNISSESITNAPIGLSNGYQWVDLYNEGISGILAEQSGGWFYKANNGNGNFAPVQQVAPRPSFNGLATGSLVLQDLDADGSKQIVSHYENITGFFELTDDNDWLPFETFRQLPKINFNDPGIRLLDLNGDGKADLLLAEEYAYRWYPSLGKGGYDSSEVVQKYSDEEKGPTTLFLNGNESIFLADMNGDGLTDIIRISNGEICYWPNLGYGLFGRKITMSNSPVFDFPDFYNPAYLHLADVSGTGATDILYLGKNKCCAWINLSGNAWSSNPYTIEPFFTTEQLNNISVIDLLGNGTACIVWSSPLPVNANAPMRYIDLMGGKKPHVMTLHRNNLGNETTVEYTSSSHFYLDDKKADNPWVTKLPFPVQCVSKTEVIDTVTDLRFASKYVYHHGYYDHAEREFRGFGMVEQTDTEEYEYLKNANASNNTSIEYYEPPVLTKTWFHTGAFLRNSKILDHFKQGYWYNNKGLVSQFGDLSQQEPALPGAQFIGDLTTSELVEAHRACKGMMLRQEVFALDGTDKEKLPYSVSTHNCYIKLLQPENNNRHAVFLVTESEAISYSYERNINDARIAHSLNIEIDGLGNVLKKAAVVYPRKIRPADLTVDKIWNEQNKQHIIITQADFTSDIITQTAYRLRLPWQTKTYELQLAKMPVQNQLFSITDFSADPVEIPYEGSFTPATDQKRLIEQVKTIYLSNDLLTQMPEGKHDSLGFNFESYQLAFSNSLLDSIYKVGNDPSKVSTAMLLEGKYIDVNNDGHWWIRSGTIQYINSALNETAGTVANRFYLPFSYTDPFGSVTSVAYYKDYSLFIQKTTDALENAVSIEEFNFRTLAPLKTKDSNANITEVVIDTLGLVVGTAIMGKGNEADDLTDFSTDLSQQETDDFFNDPFTTAANLLQHATTRLIYDFSKIPCVVGTIVREEHYSSNPGSKLQYSFSYSGGLGNIVLNKIQAEPGDAPHRDNNGQLVLNANGEPDLQPAIHRWVGNGRTILNNKGKPVKQYEPYFSDSHLYEAEPELRETGVTAILHYDAAGRLVKTLMPDDSFSKVEYDSWMQKSYDSNDTVLDSKWYADRIIGTFNEQGKDPVKEKEAAQKAAIHYNTPAIIHTDSLGRPFYSIAHNKFTDYKNGNSVKEEFYSTQTIQDIEGNVRYVIDARGNTVMQYKYDMLGHQLYQLSMDAGERWLLNDCMGKPVFAWDSKQQQFETTYDVLHRPIANTVTKQSKLVLSATIYSDTKGLTQQQLLAQQQLNLIGKAITNYDSAGIVTVIKCDFKGNILEGSRQLCSDYKVLPDWTAPASVLMEGEVFLTQTTFDALNRPVRSLTPYTNNIPASVIMPEYNEANLLNSVKVQLRGSSTITNFVNDINYDAKGQRISIAYGNNTGTNYTYDNKTYRLLQLRTTRNNGADALQDLNYSYDPVGNITNIEDKAQQKLFFKNSKVEPQNNYEYDAIYRLIKATGREHIGQSLAPNAYDKNRMVQENFPNANDANALQNYIQLFTYDVVGNMQLMRNINSWGRSLTYSATNNQLQTETINNEAGSPFNYTYDVHGNMLAMPHLPLMDWNCKDQLEHIGITASDENNFSVQAWYVYDASGQRTRKVVEKNNITEERIYLGGFDIFRRRTNGTLDLQRETLHIMDDKQSVAMIDTPVIKPANSNEVQVTRYQYSNHLGTATLELDDVAAIISYEECYPFGSTSYQAVEIQKEVAAKRYRYTGMERDEESGLEYHGARYYAAWLARWSAADPIGIGDGVNVYEYGHSNPVLFNDPEGTECPAPYDCEVKEDEKKMQPGIDFMNSLVKGIKSGDTLSIDLARAMASRYFKTTYNLDNSVFATHTEKSKFLKEFKDFGFNEYMADKLFEVLYTFAPKAKLIGWDYEGRLGTRSENNEKEAIARIVAITGASTTFGGILGGIAGILGGNASDIRRFAQLGDSLESVSAMAAVAGTNRPNYDRAGKAEPNTKKVEGNKKNVTVQPPDPPPLPKMSDKAILQMYAFDANAKLEVVLANTGQLRSSFGPFLPVLKGNAMEAEVDSMIKSNPVTSQRFVHLGGANRPDWVPATSQGVQYDFFNLLNFDLFPLNQRQRDSHFGRPYGSTMVGIYYLNPPKK